MWNYCIYRGENIFNKTKIHIQYDPQLSEKDTEPCVYCIRAWLEQKTESWRGGVCLCVRKTRERKIHLPCFSAFIILTRSAPASISFHYFGGCCFVSLCSFSPFSELKAPWHSINQSIKAALFFFTPATRGVFYSINKSFRNTNPAWPSLSLSFVWCAGVFWWVAAVTGKSLDSEQKLGLRAIPRVELY